ncbi:hypothetical protein QAD02_002387 [Eretmocerus hayati]|uniref:Uncharacterized protein n=1 Tax=Eretmocerus hayati TaxID=131215 RepID=A0ACC2NJP5_9HYME|nr:hypothetical protein QAD02_002387 [Eretmocerus hayati]
MANGAPQTYDLHGDPTTIAQIQAKMFRTITELSGLIVPMYLQQLLKALGHANSVSHLLRVEDEDIHEMEAFARSSNYELPPNCIDCDEATTDCLDKMTISFSGSAITPSAAAVCPACQVTMKIPRVNGRWKTSNFNRHFVKYHLKANAEESDESSKTLPRKRRRQGRRRRQDDGTRSAENLPAPTGPALDQEHPLYAPEGGRDLPRDTEHSSQSISQDEEESVSTIAETTTLVSASVSCIPTFSTSTPKSDFGKVDDIIRSHKMDFLYLYNFETLSTNTICHQD